MFWHAGSLKTHPKIPALKWYLVVRNQGLSRLRFIDFRDKPISIINTGWNFSQFERNPFGMLPPDSSVRAIYNLKSDGFAFAKV